MKCLSKRETGRGLAVVVLAAGVVSLWSGSAVAGTYVVDACNPSVNPGLAGAERYTNVVNAYGLPETCSSAGSMLVETNATTTHLGYSGEWRWAAPAGTRLTNAYVEANLKSGDGQRARLYSDGTPRADGNSGWKAYSLGMNASKFRVLLTCQSSTCPANGSGKAYARKVQLTLRDTSKPSVGVGNELTTSAWQRGTRALSVDSSDAGGGVRALSVTVNGRQVAPSQTYSCQLHGLNATALSPCPRNPSGVSRSFDTALGPFQDGANAIQVCAADWAIWSGSNRTCKTVFARIDNAPPSVAFRATQSPNDPDLIAAPVSDPHSGLDPSTARISYRRQGASAWRSLPTSVQGGELRARVDSQGLPAGPYEFQAEVGDNVGNEAVTTQRAGGGPMVLDFPLRAQTELRARLGKGNTERLTIPYGHDSTVAGKLEDRDGHPIAGRQLVVTEQFDPGSLVDRRIRTVTTDSDGRYSSHLPAAPSRGVSVAFAGTRKYGPADEAGLELGVRSKASLKRSKRRVRAGSRVTFKGKIGNLAAEIPPGGKLIELQVKEGARKWGTIKQAFSTDGNGRFRLGYHFGRFYTQRTTFRFRVKVTREQRWPYVAPVRSPARKLTIVP